MYDSLNTMDKKVVVIGGGTGTYGVLLGLKKYPLDLSVIVTMMDSGGSNRVIRDEFGLLPTSDLRQVMVALASDETDELLRNLFTYRYVAGTGISGMTFGNLFMAALTDILGSQEKAIAETCKLLHVSGDIIPITYEDTHLVARYSNGKQVLGEHNIDVPCADVDGHRIVEVEVFPPAKANLKALKAIRNADLVILGPGDLYTSVLSDVVVGGVADAIRRSKGKKLYVINLMTRHGQTDDFTAKDHLKEIERYIGDKVIDFVILNKSKEFPKGILKRYHEEGARPVEDDFNGDKKPKIIRGDFISKVVYEKGKTDSMVRSLIRHDPDKLAKAIMSLI
jgi:uncharacterized cofD-like protein